MIPSSIKFRNQNCFKNEWSGFDSFKPINVIIGRNNTGKSQLLDFVQVIVDKELSKSEIQILCCGELSESFLKQAFPSGTSGGPLNGDHWDRHGRLFVGQKVSWEIGSTDIKLELSPDTPAGQPISLYEKRKNAIQSKLRSINSPVYKKVLRRILADRDIRQEEASSTLSLRSDDVGATNIIRRYINSSALPEDLIQEELLQGLSEIFSDDGEFERIEIRQHDGGPSDREALWEVFLGEPRKGLVALSRSGSGLKTVVLMLLNLIVIPEIENKPKSEFVFAFEELENNLHPALLRRLFKYLADYVEREKCMVFLTTHSNVALDFFGPRVDAQIIHVMHDGANAATKTIDAHFDQIGLLSELGCRPSDLLQANGVIWLEGPSDRIYVNRLIDLYSDGELREGRDFQCAYYGGSLLARSQFADPETSSKEFANLLRLNHNIAVICDGDRTAKSGVGSKIKGRVQRIKSEVEKIPGAYLWITEAKEIENYVPGCVWSEVYRIKDVPDPGKYDTFSTKELLTGSFVAKHLKRKTFDKCEFAMEAAPPLTKVVLANRFELAAKLESLVETIREWNA